MIKVFHNKDDVKIFRESLSDKKVGLVPTMGNLHKGHLSLVSESLKNNDLTFVTIFVNPKQFGEGEDFSSYPRTLEQDLENLSQLSNDIIVFAPTNELDIYGEDFDTKISVGTVTKMLEGELRPGHFDGVTTVVYKIFEIIKPTRAYFGKKDYQQTVVIKKMVLDLGMNIQIETLQTQRSSEGLALSSRNQYLSLTEKEEALTLYKTLTNFKQQLENKELKLEDFSSKKEMILKNDPRWEYLELRSQKDLKLPLNNQRKLVLLGAFKLASTRLIDNLEVNLNL